VVANEISSNDSFSIEAAEFKYVSLAMLAIQAAMGYLRKSTSTGCLIYC
jgi:hypothetical protein